jgi:hypothetical protein
MDLYNVSCHPCYLFLVFVSIIVLVLALALALVIRVVLARLILLFQFPANAEKVGQTTTDDGGAIKVVEETMKGYMKG